MASSYLSRWSSLTVGEYNSVHRRTSTTLSRRELTPALLPICSWACATKLMTWEMGFGSISTQCLLLGHLRYGRFERHRAQLGVRWTPHAIAADAAQLHRHATEGWNASSTSVHVRQIYLFSGHVEDDDVMRWISESNGHWKRHKKLLRLTFLRRRWALLCTWCGWHPWTSFWPRSCRNTPFRASRRKLTRSIVPSRWTMCPEGSCLRFPRTWSPELLLQRCCNTTKKRVVQILEKNKSTEAVDL